MVEKVLRFGLDFWPFWPHWAASPKSLHFPQCVRVLIKTLVVPIFAAKECIRRQEFVLKIYKKIPGVPTTGLGPPRREGRHLFAPTPAECWCPSAFSQYRFFHCGMPPLCPRNCRAQRKFGGGGRRSLCPPTSKPCRRLWMQVMQNC